VREGRPGRLTGSDTEAAYEHHFVHRHGDEAPGDVPRRLDRSGLVDIGQDDPPKMVPRALVSLGIMITRIAGWTGPVSGGEGVGLCGALIAGGCSLARNGR
jgi:hypothetical protein